MRYSRHRCWVVDSADFGALLETLEGKYWNDHEDVICIPVDRLDKKEIKLLAEKLRVTTGEIENAEYIVSEEKYEN